MEDLRREENDPIASADDLIVVIEANNRKGFEMKTNDVTRTLQEWCKKQKLEISTERSPKCYK